MTFFFSFDVSKDRNILCRLIFKTDASPFSHPLEFDFFFFFLKVSVLDFTSCALFAEIFKFHAVGPRVTNDRVVADIIVASVTYTRLVLPSERFDYCKSL